MARFGDLDGGRYSTEQMLRVLTDPHEHAPRFFTNIPDAQYPSHGLNVNVDRIEGHYIYETYSTGSGTGYKRRLHEPGQIVNYVRQSVPEATAWQRDH